MDFEAWVEAAPDAIRNEPIWKVTAFRIGAFLAQTATTDSRTLRREPDLVESASQIVRAMGSISANIGDGYSRRSRADRIRFYGDALSSANESKGWYLGLRDRLGSTIVDSRLLYLGRVSQLLLVMIRNERKGMGRLDLRRVQRPDA